MLKHARTKSSSSAMDAEEMSESASATPKKSPKKKDKGVDDETTYILERRQQQQQQSDLQQNGGGGDDTEKGGDGTSGMTSTTFNYVNSIIGSGVIGAAFAIRECGVALGIATLLVVAVLTDRSLVLLVKSGNLAGTKTYQDMMSAVFGLAGFAAISFFQFMYPFISMTSYNVIMGDIVNKIFIRAFAINPDFILVRREFVIVASTVFVTLPISLYKDISKLAKVSLLSLVFVAVICTGVVLRYFTMQDQLPKEDTAVKLFDFAGYSGAFGIFTFAFMCHHNSFLLYSALRDASQRRWDAVTHVSVLAATAAMLAFALGGYFTFIDETQGDLLNNYCWSDGLMTVCRLLFAATIALTYPIECFVCREVAENVLCQFGWAQTEQKKKDFLHVGITVAIALLTCVASLSTRCLGIVLIINGVYFASPLAYILPGLSYLKLTWGKERTEESGDHKYLALILVGFGVFAMLHGTAILIINGVPGCAPDDVQMPYCLEQDGHLPSVNRSILVHL